MATATTTTCETGRSQSRQQSRDCTSSFTMFLRRFRNTKMCPASGSSPIARTSDGAYLETFAKVSWVEPVRELYDPIGRAERMIARDTTQRVTRPKGSITTLESELGYIPCLHPEEHYGFGYVDLEAVAEHPIALDPTVMSRRGQRAPRAPSQGRPS